MEEDKLKKYFFCMVFFMFGWILYLSLQSKKRGNYKIYNSPFEKEVSEEVLRKYRGEINITEYEKMDEINISNYTYSKYLENFPIIEECKVLGIQVSNDLIEEIIRKKIIFWEDDGFSDKKFKSTLKAWGISVNDYYTLIKEDVMKKQYIHFIKNSYSLPKKISDRFKKQYSKKLQVKFGIVNIKEYIDTLMIEDQNISQDILREFFNNNKNLFSKVLPAEYDLYELDSTVKSNRILLEYYQKRKMKDEIVQNFKGVKVNLVDIKNDFIRGHVDLLLKMKKDNDIFVLNDGFDPDNSKYYLLVIKKVASYIEQEYEEVSHKDVQNMYFTLNAVQNIDSSLVKEWKTSAITPSSYLLKNIPTKFVQCMFNAKINEEQRFKDSSNIYFLTVVDAYDNPDCAELDMNLKDQLDQLLIKSVMDYLRYKRENAKRF